MCNDVFVVLSLLLFFEELVIVNQYPFITFTEQYRSSIIQIIRAENVVGYVQD